MAQRKTKGFLIGKDLFSRATRYSCDLSIEDLIREVAEIAGMRILLELLFANSEVSVGFEEDCLAIPIDCESFNKGVSPFKGENEDLVASSFLKESTHYRRVPRFLSSSEGFIVFFDKIHCLLDCFNFTRELVEDLLFRSF